MISKTEPHRHNFTKLGYVQDFGSARRTNALIQDVVSRDIRRIILIRICSCSQSQAFECGAREAMRELFKLIKNSEGKR